MKKNLSFITIVLSVLLLIFGCTAQTKIADYQPKSAEEKEVVKFFTECDEAYQDRNLPKWLECFHDDAKIMIYQPGAPSQPIVSKPQYKDYLEGGRDSDMSRSGILNPKIAITGDRATLKFQFRDAGYSIHETYDLVKENEKWRIIRSVWTWK